MADLESQVEEGLVEGELAESPFVQLQEWLDVARASGAPDSNAMCVSTVSAEGRPSSRMVLLKVVDERGLAFFTNYASRKGLELAGNPMCCATLWWGALQRQVRIEGGAERVSAEESDAYFYSRRPDSRLASAVSPQSHVVEDRETLEAMFEAISLKYIEGDVPRPEHWGGFRIVPDRFEFWAGRRARLHDRLVYAREGAGWKKFRLAP